MAITLSCLLLASCQNAQPVSREFAEDSWPVYHGDDAGTHYSRLADINVRNVSQLKQAWEYDTGDAIGEGASGSDMQSNPLIIAGKLFFVSPKGRLISLDAKTGREIWVFNPAGGAAVNTRQRLRGVSWWSQGSEQRILFTFRGKLFAVDAKSGKPAANFGKAGSVDLSEGIGRDRASVSVTNVSPGAIWRDLIILGSTGYTPGHIRAFNVRTGKLAWVFHTIPWPGEDGYETWPKDAWKNAMGANNWAGMALDTKRGIVYLPLASGGMANKDFYGADRHGDNLFANSVVALDASTGKKLWHFQTVRHDLWDRDLPAPPTLITVVRDGKKIDALAQITKSGLVFVLDRVTGKPLFPIEYREVPASDIRGEQAAATQPFPTLPAPFARQRLSADMLTNRTPEARAAAAKTFAGVRSRGPFDPPSVQGTILLPGMDGGAEWGGGAFDPQTGLFYVNSNEMAWIIKLKARPPAAGGTGGRALFLNNCAACHGEDRRGSPPEFPSLVGVSDRLPTLEAMRIVLGGAGRMPAFGGKLSVAQVDAILEYLRTGRDTEAAGGPRVRSMTGSDDAYVFDGYAKFLDPDGYPAIAPPWGTLSAINLNTGKYAWKIPFGEYPELAAKGMRNTGSENYGGAIVTAGGLLFIGATSFDRKFHAFDKMTGKLLWETLLPAGGNATPATYRVDGRQFVVIAAGGGKNPKAKSGSKIVAFALPE